VATLLLALLVALSLGQPAAAREPRVCVAGTSIGCDDRNPCTDDRCDETLVCMHTPATGPACNDHDACTEHDRCEAGTCVGVPVTCKDDGLSCTDDVCLGGECTHVPVDSRCVAEDTCTTSVCAPGHGAERPTGCALGPPQADGYECAEDGDPCTADVCGGGRCAHLALPDRETCSAVAGAFRQALALEGTARGLQEMMSPATPAPVLTRLAGIRDALETTARILSGKTHADATPTPPGALPQTPLQQRARLALGVLARARPQVVAFARSMRGSPGRGYPAGVPDLRQRSRSLVHGTRALRGQLRRLLGVRSTLVR